MSMSAMDLLPPVTGASLMFQYEWQSLLETTDRWGLTGLLLRLAIGGAVIVLLYRAFFKRRVDFSIVVKSGKVVCEGKLPLALRPGLQTLLLEDLAPLDSVRIMGTRSKDGLRLWFCGNVTNGQQQRIRNFLLSRH
jgi:hypothetical protein